MHNKSSLVIIQHLKRRLSVPPGMPEFYSYFPIFRIVTVPYAFQEIIEFVMIVISKACRKLKKQTSLCFSQRVCRVHETENVCFQKFELLHMGDAFPQLN